MSLLHQVHVSACTKCMSVLQTLYIIATLGARYDVQNILDIFNPHNAKLTFAAAAGELAVLHAQ